MSTVTIALCLLAARWIAAPPPSPPDEGAAPVTLALDDGGSIEVVAHWDRITSSTYGLEKDDRIASLAPVDATREVPTSRFRPLLPTGPVAIGDRWTLNAAELEPILAQLHAGVTTTLHHSSEGQGAYAVLRAVGDRFAEIAFRVHAEFRLADGRSFYTPAQFAGRLRIDRDRRRVAGVRIQVPPRNSNVDVNLFLEAVQVPGHDRPFSGFSADIGFVPRLELVGGDADGDEPWTEEIAPAVAERRLAEAFYGFLAVDWLPFADAVARSRETGKPLHVVALFGVLDDESC